MVQTPDGPDGPALDGTENSLQARTSAWFERARQFLSRGESDGDPADDETDAGTEVPDDGLLLTDEERILDLLEGSKRMKQSVIVDQCDWSKAKVSRLLSSMEESGEVCRTQVGREKIVTLPEAQFEAAKSPFEEDEEESRVMAR